MRTRTLDGIMCTRQPVDRIPAPLSRTGVLAAIASATLLVPAPPIATSQAPPEPTRFAEDAFLDPAARELYTAAFDGWDVVGKTIERYTSRIDQRIAVKLRALRRDRVLYHSETAVRAFWERGQRSVIQVLGSRSQYPGRSFALDEGDLNWLSELPFDEPFEPGSDQLFVGGDRDDEPFQPSEDGFWLAHPLGLGADTLYRFQSGDTTTLTFPDGRHLTVVQLDVLPRELDPRRISGTLWIEPTSGGLVRGVYRLSRKLDVVRDIPGAREETADGYRYVPGFLKPFTFEMKMVAVEYSLWDFKVWLPRSMRIEGEVAAGMVKFPVSTDIAYRIESVTHEEEVADAGGAAIPPGQSLEEVYFDSRAEAIAFIAQLLSEDGETTYEHVSEEVAGGRRSRWIAPPDRATIEESPHLPPPIWKDAPGFPSDRELKGYVKTLAGLPVPQVAGTPWYFNWGWGARDMLRYNRVEGPALGGRLDWTVHGAVTLSTSGFFGFADLRPKVRLDLERATVLRRLSLGAYHELRATDAESDYLGMGNSTTAFFFGRDDGEYYHATGVDLSWRPPAIARQSFRFRAYAERQTSAESNTNFAFFRILDGAWDFRPNAAADKAEEAGGELRLSPRWGNDPAKAHFGIDLFGRGAAWRRPGAEAYQQYGQASAQVWTIVPVLGDGWRRWQVAVEAAAGNTWGHAPVQRSWFLGGAGTLRGYPASTLSGLSFMRGRIEVARTYEGVAGSLFGDVGWAGPRNEFDSGDLLYGIGLGASILDGAFRFDLSQGLKGPRKDFRVELYLDAIF